MKRHAFTLIELLVVIAIIAALAAILFPVFAAARERAKAANCTSNMKQLAYAFLMYAESSNGHYPQMGAANKGASSADWVLVGKMIDHKKFAIADVRGGSLYPYVKDPRVYVCADDPTKTEVTYMMCRPFNLKSQSFVSWPATSILQIEEGTPDRNGDLTPHNDGVFYPLLDDHNWRAGWAGADVPAGWHSGRSMYGFADGHAKSLLQVDVIPRHGFKPPNYPRFFHWFQPDRATDEQ